MVLSVLAVHSVSYWMVCHGEYTAVYLSIFLWWTPGLCLVWAIINKAVMSILVQVLLWNVTFKAQQSKSIWFQNPHAFYRTLLLLCSASYCANVYVECASGVFNPEMVHYSVNTNGATMIFKKKIARYKCSCLLAIFQ